MGARTIYLDIVLRCSQARHISCPGPGTGSRDAHRRSLPLCPALRDYEWPSPRHGDQIAATLATTSPPDGRNARIYADMAKVVVMDILSVREQSGSLARTILTPSPYVTTRRAGQSGRLRYAMSHR